MHRVGGTALIALVVTLAGGLIAGVVLAHRAGGGASAYGPRKAAAVTAEAAQQRTAEAGPHAPKPLGVTPAPTRAHCPVDTSTIQTAITGPTYPPPPGSQSIFDQITLVSEATAVGADGRPYSLYVGTERADATQWVIVRWQGAKDPCAEGRPDYPPSVYDVPLKSQSLTLTHIDAHSLSFRTGSGSTGSFNYVVGDFSQATP